MQNSRAPVTPAPPHGAHLQQAVEQLDFRAQRGLLGLERGLQRALQLPHHRAVALLLGLQAAREGGRAKAARQGVQVEA